MSKLVDFRTYLTLETALIRRLLKDWRKRAEPVFTAITQQCKDGQWDKARQQVPDLDLYEVGSENREWIKYLLLSMAVYGAGRVAKSKPSFVGVGSFDGMLNQVTANLVTYLEHDATKQLQAEALQLIAEDEAKSKVQKQEHQYGIVMLLLDPTSSAATTINAAREGIDLQDIKGEGKRIEGNHLTVRYGLLNDDVDRLREFIRSLSPFEARLGKLETFEPTEHSEWATPLVARVLSPELHAIHAEIGSYADFKEETFPEYKPHITLAYLKPEEAQRYKQLYVDGSFIVRSLTIGHQSGVLETIPFGMARKADSTGRFVTPHVRFDQLGEDKLQLISSLNASRLATWGFVAEAEVRGIKRYQLNAVLDGRTSRFCEMIHGKEFEVEDARKKVMEVLNVQNPDDLKTVQPWTKQTNAAMEEYKGMTDDDFKARGLLIPPFHPSCRTTLKLVSEEVEVKKPVPVGQPTMPPQMISLDTLREIGITATAEQVAHWNAYIGLSPVELLSKISGMTPKEILEGRLGSRAIGFAKNGDIAINARGVMGDVKYSVGTVLDPYTGTYYLSEAEMVADVGAEAEFLRRLFTTMIEIGQNTVSKTLAVQVGGNAVHYAKLGFLPDPSDWAAIRAEALDSLENGDLKAMYASMADDQKLLVTHLLQDMDEHALSALVDLHIEFEGKTVGEWILKDFVGAFKLDLTDPFAIEQAQAYLRTL